LSIKTDANEFKQLYEGEDVWMVDFFQRMELKEIVEIANVANYLDIARLLDASLAALALHKRRVVF
jgi:hypothetical protein